MNMSIDWSIVASALLRLLPVLVVILAYLGTSRGLDRCIRSNWLTPRMGARVRTLTRWLALTAATLLVLQSLGLVDHAWALITGFAAAAAIGFVAHWSILSNWASAFLILFYGRFEVGDEIELLEAFDKPEGLRGRVADINLLFVELEEAGTESSRMLQIPNNLFFQKTVRVRTRGKRQRAGR